MEHRQLTLMFTDIVGYSRLMGRDQAQTIAMLEDYRRILVEEIDKQQGTVIEFIGDAVFARFETPGAGVNAAIAIQKALFAFNHFRDKSLPRLQTRIGLHTGEVATKDDAVFGDDVNIAARLEPIAVADGICVSEQVYQAVKSDLKEPVLSLGVQPLKNIQSKVRAYLIRPLGINLRIRGHYINRRFNEKVGAYRYAIAASVLFLIAAGIYYVPRWLVPGYDANYVEIADFQNLMNEGGEADYLSAGISEAVRAQLADMKDVYVLKTGEGVQAPLMIEGSVQKLGDNLRIAYQLKRRDGEVQIAGGKLDGKYDEIFILQDRVVGEIAGYLADEFDIPNFRPAKINSTSDVLAYEYYMRGLDYLHKPLSVSNSDEAAKFFTTALVHDKHYSDAEIGICRAYWQKFLLTKEPDWLVVAESRCSNALSLTPDRPQALESMGVVFSALGKNEQAIELLNKAIQKDVNNSSILVNLASVYFSNGNFEKAHELLNFALETYPNHWQVYNALGWQYLTNGNIDSAISTYKQLLKITPRNNTALSNLGLAYLQKGLFADAMRSFEKAVDLVPSSWAFTNIGLTHFYLGDMERAIAAFKQAIDLDPTDYELHLNYAEALHLASDKTLATRSAYDRAFHLAQKAFEHNNNDPYVNYTLSMYSLYEGDLTKAYSFILNALDYAPNDPYVLYGLLKVQLESGQHIDALETVTTMLDLGYSKKLINADPALEKLRSFSGYQELVAQTH